MALLNEVRLAVRGLAKSPGLSVTILATLALGLGVNTTVFTVVNALLLRPLPAIPDPQELVAVFTREERAPGVSSYADFVDLRRESSTFAGLAAYKHLGLDLTAGERSDRLSGALVSADYFTALGLTPAAGRFFVAGEDQPEGGAAVAVLSHGLWRDRFGADPGAVGRSVTLNGRDFEVVGVAPEGFRGVVWSTRPEVFVPITQQPVFMPGSQALLLNRNWSGIHMVGRLRAGVSLEAARADLERVAAGIGREHPESRGRQPVLVPFDKASLSPSMRGQVVSFSALLMGVAALVLLTTSVNVSNLMLARGIQRRRELAVRRALGASNARLVGHLLLEGLLLAAAGGALSLLAALWAGDLLASSLAAFEPDLTPDGRVVAFAAAASLASALLFSLAPGIRARRLAVAPVLRDEAGSVGGARGQALSRILVVAQVALSLVLLATAGLFTRTLSALQGASGFAAEEVLVAGFDPQLEGYSAEESRDFYRRLRERLAALPGVAAVGFASSLPGQGADTNSVTVEGAPPVAEGERMLYVSVVGGDYFAALGIPLLAGRALGDQDGEGRPLAVVVNRAAGRALEGWAGRPAVGQRLSFNGPGGPYFEVVGLAEDAATESLREGARPAVFLEHRQVPASSLGGSMALLARVAGDPLARLPDLEAVVRQLDPRVPVVQPAVLAQFFTGTLVAERMAAGLSGFSALLALALAAVGLYGVLAFAVGRRAKELGLRLALGAGRADLLRLVIGEGMKLTAIGLAAGFAGALAVGRLLSRFLFGVAPADPATLGGVTAILAVVSLAACYLPARKAARVDPLLSLRDG